MRKIQKIISASLITFLVFASTDVKILAEKVNDNSLNTTNTQTQKLKVKNISGITRELEEKRTENTKTYQREDGSYEIAEYGTAVNYNDKITL
ncbi:hypothetical protein KYB31_12410 [Clostridium felsineum]|uniref:hypothetical protein n=1 Tax=Clostridium felsineum TaxID=36839 RepID=UPI00214D9492|nr:hypothetical protein [Clostridium felsineum]MCR3759775.1 hypothetical protein [Clostridium felsineum]